LPPLLLTLLLPVSLLLLLALLALLLAPLGCSSAMSFCELCSSIWKSGSGKQQDTRHKVSQV
jgi:hypothetical protein